MSNFAVNQDTAKWKGLIWTSAYGGLEKYRQQRKAKPQKTTKKVKSKEKSQEMVHHEPI